MTVKVVLASFFILLSLNLKSQGKSLVNVQLAFDKAMYKPVSSKSSDFGAVYYNGKVWWASNREFDYVNWGENLWHKKKYYNIFYTDAVPDSTAKKGKANFRNDPVFEGYHNGPISFSRSGDTIFYTKVLKSPYKSDNKKMFKPQLFMAVNNGGKFDKEKLLPFCLAQYTFAHPCFDPSTNTLYFVSDVKGKTMGGTDIFKSTLLEDGSWSDVENLGPLFNTEFNEQFPFMWHNKELFYTTNAKEAEKGLEIMWSWKNEKGNWSSPKFLESPVNTSADDFSFYLLPNGKKGFLSSSVSGRDEVYILYIDRQVTFEGNSLSGKFTYRNINSDPSELSVQLVDENGLVLKETTTDKEGAFQFNTIPSDSSYTIRVKEDTGEELLLQIFDKNGKKIAVLLSNDKGEFLYKKLEYENSILSYMDEEDFDLELNQADFQGQFLYSKKPGEFPSNMPLVLEDSLGQVVRETITDKFGNFQFKKLSADAMYYLKLGEEVDDDLLLLVFNSQDNVVAVLRKNADDAAMFRKINPDIENNLNVINDNDNPFQFKSNYLIGNVNYKKIEGDFGSGLKIQVFNEEGLLLEETYSNALGEFRFNHLPLDNQYFIKIQSDDENLKYDLNDLFIDIFDRFGNKVGTLKYDENGYFLYRPLQADIQNNLAIVDENDETLNLDFKNNNNNNNSKNEEIKNEIPKEELPEKVKNVTTGGIFTTIYFDLNSSFFNPQNKKEMKKLLEYMKNNPQVKIEIKSYADSRSNEEYNLWISKNRTLRVTEYLERNGISSDRINGKFFGEQYLVNECGNNDECPEELHRLNRRSEIIVK